MQILPPVAVPATVTFSGVAPVSTPYASSGDPNLLTPVSVFSQQSTTAAAATIIYSTSVAASDVKIGVYEGVLHITYPTSPLSSVKYTLKI